MSGGAPFGVLICCTLAALLLPSFSAASPGAVTPGTAAPCTASPGVDPAPGVRPPTVASVAEGPRPVPAETTAAPSSSPAVAAGSDSGTRQSSTIKSWSEGKSRPFLATRTDLGFLFLKPRASVGYGKPHFIWAGGDFNPLVSGRSIGGYLGGRLAHPNADLRVGGRYLYSFNRSFLEPRDSYNHVTVESLEGPHASYLSWEAEFTYGIPIGFGSFFGEIAGTIVTAVDDGFYVFEDEINAVVAPPYVWRKRVGYSLAFGFRRAIRLGFVGEVVGIPKRDALIYRAGAQLSLRMSPQFQVRMFAIPVVSSPDKLGAAGGDAFAIGIRYRWATD